MDPGGQPDRRFQRRSGMYSRPGRAIATRVVGVLALATLTGVALAGCNSSSASSNASSSGSSSSSANIAEASKIIQEALAPPSAIMQTVPLTAKPSPGSIVFLDNGLPGTQVIANRTRERSEE